MTTIHTLDLKLMGASGVIAAYALVLDDGVAIFETGPASTAASVEAGLAEHGFELADLKAIFVTHVHLDHSGAAGLLAGKALCPVYAHPKGMHHLVDPSKLLASAERIYGEMLVPLWGETRAVPQELARSLDDQETVQLGGHEICAWHTPGHASHHVAWQIGDAIVTGDVGGMRFQPSTHVVPPMPPPDIDVDLWITSLDTLRKADPKRLLLTHFGAVEDVGWHLDELESRLGSWTGIASMVMAEGGDRKELVRRLEALDDEEFQPAQYDAEVVQRYRHLCPMKENSAGLWRYVERRDGA